jgi:hypothetical protein
MVAKGFKGLSVRRNVSRVLLSHCVAVMVDDDIVSTK